MATIHTFNGNEIIATEVPKYLNDNFSALNSVGEDIKTQLGAKAPLASPTLTGTPKAPTASEGTNTTQIATTAFVTNAVKVKSVNGKTGDVVVGEIKDLSINGTTVTVTFADDTTKTLTTQDTVNSFTGAVSLKHNSTVAGTSSGYKTITISSLTALKPLYIGIKCTKDSTGMRGYISSGTAINATDSLTYSDFGLKGVGSVVWRTVVPTGTSVVINIHFDGSDEAVQVVAYQ